jgi:aspartate carbamoyltransferase catalytic subunit
MKNTIKKDIISAVQYTKDSVDAVVERARDMKRLVESGAASDILRGNMMTVLFYEPSSRTFGSFISAMQRLGGGCIPIQGVSYSSVSKGETLEDTARTFASYSDVLVLRYPHPGGAKIAADVVDIPVINAGDGSGEHPTQALLDIYTIMNHVSVLEGASIALVGDLLNGRTVHSLVVLLSLYKPKTIYLVAPDDLQMPEMYMTQLREAGISFFCVDTLDDVLPKVDVLYVTRVQKERFRDLDAYEQLKHRYVITPDLMARAKKDMILMHPFPRVGEIDTRVDSDQRAVYLREQMKNGLYIRMALLAMVLGK